MALFAYIALLSDSPFAHFTVGHAAERGASGSSNTANSTATSQSPGRRADLLAQVKVRLSKDNRFRKIKASVSQPGVVILEGEVFDEEVKQLAVQRVHRGRWCKKSDKRSSYLDTDTATGAEPHHSDTP
jgi:hypothetical protein